MFKFIIFRRRFEWVRCVCLWARAWALSTRPSSRSDMSVSISGECEITFNATWKNSTIFRSILHFCFSYIIHMKPLFTERMKYIHSSSFFFIIVFHPPFSFTLLIDTVLLDFFTLPYISSIIFLFHSKKNLCNGHQKRER